MEDPKIKELLERIQKDVGEKKQFGIVSGVFGDMENCEGLVESVIESPEGGIFIKVYGCSYLFKGYPVKQIVEGMGLAKAMISMIPRRIIVPSFLIKTALLLLAIFSKKRFVHYLRVYFDAITINVVMKFGLAKEKYNVFAKEIMRATDVILKRELKVIGETYELMINERFKSRMNRWEECELVKAMSDFIAFFLQNDNAYRLRTQDGFFGELNKENIIKFGIVFEMKRLFKILIDREIDVKHKFVDLEKIVIPLLIISKDARKWLVRFLLEVNIEKLKLDEADRYFCLRRRGHKFFGVSLEDRLKEKERIDKEKGHISLKLIRKEDYEKLNGTASGTASVL